MSTKLIMTECYQSIHVKVETLSSINIPFSSNLTSPTTKRKPDQE